MTKLAHLWRNLTRRGKVDAEIDAELRATFDLIEDEGRAAGLSADAARRAARLALGRSESLRERIHDVKAGAFLQTWMQDARYALRLLRRGPLFAGFAVVSLALGIGATGAIFSLFDTIALRRLPVPEPDRLVIASLGRPGTTFNYSMPYPQFAALRDRSAAIESIFAVTPLGRVTVTAHGDPEAATGLYVSGDYYRTLRLVPAAGRLLSAEDDRPGQSVAVLTHAYWQRRFGGRADAIGGTIALNGVPFTVVGVEPPGFAGTEVGRPYDLSVPLRSIETLSEERPSWNGPFTTWLYVMGRLKPGVSIDAAEREAQPIFAQASMDFARNAGDGELARETRLRLESGVRGSRSDLRTSYAQWLQLLLALLGAVLLLSSLNVATLLLARCDARRREIETRLALGAARWRVVRQLLTESAVLSAAAAVPALAIAVWGGRLLLLTATPNAERPPVTVGLDARLLLFTLAISAATCLLFGFIPALRATAAHTLMARQSGGGRRRRMLDRTLVGLQVAVSLVLLVAAGLFARTLDKLWLQHPGYQRQNIVMFSVDPRLAGKKGDDVPRSFRQILVELQTMPSAAAVTISAVRPISPNYYFVTSFTDLGTRQLPREQRVRAAFNHVAPGYFSTLGIPLIAGREFTDADAAGAQRVAIISERMAGHFEGNPIGQTFGGGRQIVGIVKDVRYASVRDAEREVVYFPFFQVKPQELFYTPTFEIRLRAANAGIAADIRSALARVDRALMPFAIKTLERQTEESFARERLLAIVAGYFGAFAMLLACVGLYGLLSYTVTLRTAEIGLRMALGAPPGAVRRMIVGESAWTVVAGIATGLAAAAFLAGLVRSQLFGVEPRDPISLAAAAVLLATLALAAADLPARRASRIDPLTALRHE